MASGYQCPPSDCINSVRSEQHWHCICQCVTFLGGVLKPTQPCQAQTTSLPPSQGWVTDKWKQLGQATELFKASTHPHLLMTRQNWGLELWQTWWDKGVNRVRIQKSVKMFDSREDITWYIFVSEPLWKYFWNIKLLVTECHYLPGEVSSENTNLLKLRRPSPVWCDPPQSVAILIWIKWKVPNEYKLWRDTGAAVSGGKGLQTFNWLIYIENF